jgi:methyl-accepting chemotaxis protein
MSFSSQQAPNVVFERLDSVQPSREKPSRRSRNPLIHLSIAPRLVLGFLIPALIAALVAGIIGVQSAQLLSQESAFYQTLFQSYAGLTTGNDFLQLMDFKTHATITDAQGMNPSADQLHADQQAVQGLVTRYDTLLSAYVQHQLLTQHPEQAALFEQAGHPGESSQQSVLASSALRTWRVYRDAQNAVLQEILQGHSQTAQTLERTQGEPTYFDALSALRQLIQFDGRLTVFVQDATALQERTQLITTLVAIVVMLFAIGVIGRLIYGTLVRRLRQLQYVAQAVQQGHLTRRTVVDGRDEITEVETAVNAMLDTIVGLLDETRLQRDALTQAATRLFSEVRLANGDEFDVSAAVTTDPIGMLGNAFQFTVGRFRRFVLRTKRTIEPLEVVSQQEIHLANAFLASVRQVLHGTLTTIPSTPLPTGNAQNIQGQAERALQDEHGEGGNTTLLAHIERLRGLVRLIMRQDVEQQGPVVQQLVEQTDRHCQQLAMVARIQNARGIPSAAGDAQALETLFRQLGGEVQTRKKNTMQHLADMEVALDQLAVGVRAGGVPRASANAVGMQAQEISRLAEGFAQEVGTLAQRLRVLTQEMRSSLTPFRVEDNE